jgi:hypothetical protein
MNQYYCPYCRSPVAAGEPVCRKCGRPLVWNTADVGGRDEDRQDDGDTGSGAKKSWLWPLLALVFVAILAGVGIYMLLRMAEKPPVPLANGNTTEPVQEGLIIPDTRIPVISNIIVNSISYNSVEIKWTTDEPSTSQVIWRSGDGKMSSTDEKEAMVNQHVVELADLKNKQMYYFKVRSADQAGNEAFSVEDSFDVGLSHGVAGISVAGDSMKTEEPQPSVFRTIISGNVINTGEVPVRTRDIEVWIKITVAGKAGTSDVKAELDPTPDILNPLYETGFRAVVPNRTDPQYTITSKITAKQD